jgi:hypothetical protein
MDSETEILRDCAGCGAEMDVSEQPYIHLSYYLRPDDGGFCCSTACAKRVLERTDGV